MMTSTVALVALFTSAPLADATTVELPASTPVRIVASAAQVEVREGPVGRISFRADLDRALDRVSFGVRCGKAQLLLRPLVEGQLVYGRLEVVVPAGSEVEIVAAAGFVDVMGVESPVHVESVDADVRIEDAGSEIYARTLSGDVEIDGVGVTVVKVESATGDLRFTGRLAEAAQTSMESLTGRAVWRTSPEPGIAVIAGE